MTARVYMVRGKYEEALHILEEGIQKFPNDINLRLSKAGLLIDRDRLDEAEQIFSDVKKCPNADRFERDIMLQKVTIASKKMNLKNDVSPHRSSKKEEQNKCDEQARYMLMMTANFLQEYDIVLEQAEALD